jgi:hypothetical protein
MQAGEEGRRGAGAENTGKGTTEQAHDTREHMKRVRTIHASSLAHAAPQHNTTRHLRSTTAHQYTTRRLPCTRPGTTCAKLRLSSFSPPHFTLCRRGENSFDAFLWWAFLALCLTSVASKTIASKSCLPSVPSKACFCAPFFSCHSSFFLWPLEHASAPSFLPHSSGPALTPVRPFSSHTHL